MGYTEMGKLIDRILVDAEVRKLLLKDPKEAARRCGIQLTDSEVESIKKVDWNLTDEELKARMSKAM